MRERNVFHTETPRRGENGTSSYLAQSVRDDYIADAEDVWYDVYVQLDGTNIALYAGTRDGGMKRLARCVTSVAASTNPLEVRMNESLDIAL